MLDRPVFINAKYPAQFALGILLLATLSFAGFAEIVKTAVPGDKGLKLYWWPKLPVLKGWEQDTRASQFYGTNALAPTDKSFADSETVMYARAIYKPRVPKMTSLGMLIDNDQNEFKSKNASLVITRLEDIKDGDGKPFQVYTFAPGPKNGNWEAVAYGEEGDFYLIFTISSRTENGYKRDFPAYKELLQKYQEKLPEQPSIPPKAEKPKDKPKP